jgi:hypothetical protein
VNEAYPISGNKEGMLFKSWLAFSSSRASPLSLDDFIWIHGFRRQRLTWLSHCKVRWLEKMPARWGDFPADEHTSLPSSDIQTSRAG